MPTLAMLYPPVNFWLALLSLSTKFRSQLKPPPMCSSPLNPALKYQVLTSWSKMRGPASIGRRGIQPKFGTKFGPLGQTVELGASGAAHRSIPNGLYGLRRDTLM